MVIAGKMRLLRSRESDGHHGDTPKRCDAGERHEQGKRWREPLSSFVSPVTSTETSVGANRWMTPHIRCSCGLRLISVRRPSTYEPGTSARSAASSTT